MIEYISPRDKALKKIKERAKGKDIEILDEIIKETDPAEREKRDSNCQMVRMVMDKCLENYKAGEYSFKVTINMICEALEAIK